MDFPESGAQALREFRAHGYAAAWLEHDPEKWIPVFGKDHAPPMM
jgi:hypothetical protein